MQTIADFYTWYWGVLIPFEDVNSDPSVASYFAAMAPLVFLSMSAYTVGRARNPKFLDEMPWGMGIAFSLLLGGIWPAYVAILWGVLLAAPLAIPLVGFFIALYWLAKPRKPKEVVAPDPMLEAANAEVEKMLEER
jgi:hypothetical protein